MELQTYLRLGQGRVAGVFQDTGRDIPLPAGPDDPHEHKADLLWRHLYDLAILDDVADFRIGAQQRLLPGDDHFFGDAAGFELEIDRDRLAETKRDAGSNRAAEPLQLGGNGVCAGAKRCEEITSLAIGHALDARAALEMLRDNAHAGQHAALAVAYDAGDFTRVGLCGGRKHRRQDQQNG